MSNTRKPGMFTSIKDRREANREIEGLEQGDQLVDLLQQLLHEQQETNRLLRQQIGQPNPA